MRLTREQATHKREPQIKRIEQLCAHVAFNVLFGPNGRDDFAFIHEAHRKKLEKLSSGGYKMFACNELFVLSDTYADKAMCEEELTIMLCLASSKAASFEIVAVSMSGTNIRFNLTDKSFDLLVFGRNEQFDIACKAREEVLKADRAQVDGVPPK